jgi:antitoxin ParD1/3/4
MELETENTTTELTISLPESMKEFIERGVAEGNYSTPSEYVRDLVEEALDRKNEERLEKLLLEGLDSGEPIKVTPEFWTELRAELTEKYGKRGE